MDYLAPLGQCKWPPHWSKLDGCGGLRSRLLHSLEPALNHAHGCWASGWWTSGASAEMGLESSGVGAPSLASGAGLGAPQTRAAHRAAASPHTASLMGAQAVVQELQQTGKKLVLSARPQKPAASLPLHSVEKETRSPSSKGGRPRQAKAGEGACPVLGG